jgi:TonB family protein
MPITEIPPSPSSSSSPPPEPPLGKSRARYHELEPEELFHVIDDLEGSKTRGRIREFIYVSIILHMMLFWYLAYGPRYFQHIRVVNPSDILKQREKEITSVDLTDAIKKLKSSKALPKTAAPKPTIDQKTLEAMRRAEPPRPQPPAPQPEQQAPPPQVAQQTPPPPIQQPTQPLQNNPLSNLEAPKPKPAPTAPNFNTGPSNPGDAIRQAARAAAQAPPTFGGELGGGAQNGPGSAGGAQILSDTMGVDFGPYMKRIVYDTERAWWPIIPEVARPPLNKAGRVMIRFKIMKDGSVKEMILEGPSGDVSLDRAAWGGILGASPYPQLPKEFKGPYLELRFYFLYNVKPSDE